MTAGEDVTRITWEPVRPGGPGEVTIEHESRDPLTISMHGDAVRRLVDRLLGTDKREIALAGGGLRWDRKSLAFTATG